jgi:phosphatidylinositol alpha-1,6-mannosyltransferase
MTSETVTTETAVRHRGESVTAAAVARHALLLAPSRGRGGGIERYVETVEAAFADQGVTCGRLDLARPGLNGHRALLAGAADALSGTAEPTRLIVAHTALLPVAALIVRKRQLRGISVICHGSEVWRRRNGPRWQLESRLMRRGDVRIVAVSSFTAGALFPGTQATILPPGLSSAWYGELVTAGTAGTAGTASTTAGRQPGGGLELTTAFRLDDWRGKGLPELIDAITALRRPDIRLTVCGSGTPPTDLLAHVVRYPWCTVRPGLTDSELAAQLASSDLFVLATRTRSGRWASGEGFGLVLLEAQVAGTAVVGPAYGGSPDAYLDGVTGATPRDESVAALAHVLDALAGRPDQLRAMGARGASWARERFDPDRYAALAVDRLL